MSEKSEITRRVMRQGRPPSHPHSHREDRIAKETRRAAEQELILGSDKGAEGDDLSADTQALLDRSAQKGPGVGL